MFNATDVFGYVYVRFSINNNRSVARTIIVYSNLSKYSQTIERV